MFDRNMQIKFFSFSTRMLLLIDGHRKWNGTFALKPLGAFQNPHNYCNRALHVLRYQTVSVYVTSLPMILVKLLSDPWIIR